MRARWAEAAPLAGLLALGGCGGFQLTCPVLPELPRGAPAGHDEVEVRFLGVGGFLIRYTPRGSATRDTVLTGPLYSNPTFGEIATQSVHQDGRLIDALLPREADDARAIFVGHGHYDHLLDVPWVAEHRTPRAVIYGNDAVYDLLQPSAKLRARVKSLEPFANHACAWTGDGGPACSRAWRPFPVPGLRLRVWTVLSEHSAQFPMPGLLGWFFPDPVHLWRGAPLEPPTALPRRISDWHEGTTLAYVFDFLNVHSALADERWDSEQVVFRIYYQDSAARRPFGFPPTVYNERGATLPARVDLALLCVGGSQQVADSPVEIVRALAPSWAMGQHWDDFFNPRQLQLPRSSRAAREPAYEQRRVVIAGANLKGFERRLRATLPQDSMYTIACPDAITRFVRGAQGAWRIDVSSDRWRRAH